MVDIDLKNADVRDTWRKRKKDYIYIYIYIINIRAVIYYKLLEGGGG